LHDLVLFNIFSFLEHPVNDGKGRIKEILVLWHDINNRIGIREGFNKDISKEVNGQSKNMGILTNENNAFSFL
jgi:hypothetical protein